MDNFSHQWLYKDLKGDAYEVSLIKLSRYRERRKEIDELKVGVVSSVTTAGLKSIDISWLVVEINLKRLTACLRIETGGRKGITATLALD